MEVSGQIAAILAQRKDQTVWAIAPEATVFEAIDLMAQKNVGALPVVDNGRLAGIISERDYARQVILKGKSSKEIPVKEIMTEQVLTVQPMLANVPAHAKVAREETFGPLAPLFRFETDEEVVRLANDTEFGLASYFYSRDIGRIWRVAEAIESGMVGINTGMVSTEVAPFGGVKQSGLGWEGSHYGIDEFVEVKYLCFGGLDR